MNVHIKINFFVYFLATFDWWDPVVDLRKVAGREGVKSCSKNFIAFSFQTHDLVVFSSLDQASVFCFAIFSYFLFFSTKK